MTGGSIFHVHKLLYAGVGASPSSLSLSICHWAIQNTHACNTPVHTVYLSIITVDLHRKLIKFQSYRVLYRSLWPIIFAFYSGYAISTLLSFITILPTGILIQNQLQRFLPIGVCAVFAWSRNDEVHLSRPLVVIKLDVLHVHKDASVNADRVTVAGGAIQLVNWQQPCSLLVA